MFRILLLLVTTIFRCLPARRTLLQENLVLRQQLTVLKRKHPRPRLREAILKRHLDGRCAAGRPDRMFEFLEAAWVERDPYLTRIDAEPYFEPYRSNPRFRALLAKMNLVGDGR
jgi:hypothetical protein